MSLPSISWTLGSATLPGGATSTHVPVFVPGIDLALDVNGDLVIGTDLSFTTGLQAVEQGIRLRVQMFLGEWFNDLTRGVPWFQEILGHKFSSARIRQIFSSVIAEAPGVTSIQSLTADFNRGTRALTVTFSVLTTYGVSTNTLTIAG